MPALAFGLKPSKPGSTPSKAPPKRKAAFDEPDDDATQDDNNNDAFSSLQKSSKPRSQNLNKGQPPPRKSPKLDTARSSNGNDNTYSNNLSALRSAKLQDAAASKLDPSAYSYDEVYDSFSATSKDKKKDESSTNGNGESTVVPKYMTNLLASAEIRKRDQLKAKEKALQKERDAEGDEFADKEAFVTGAYKKQQEEMRRIEEEEKKREELEDERRRKGGGLTAFNKELLRRDEERTKAVEEAQAQAKTAQQHIDENTTATSTDIDPSTTTEEQQKPESKIAAELNSAGANIITNDDGEIVDKRQLLTAGLNIAPKKPSTTTATTNKSSANSAQDQRQRSTRSVNDARTAQRERQTRMMERQIEEIEAKARETAAAERKDVEEKNTSKLTETDKLSAKERYLARKREKEEEMRKEKEKSNPD